MFIFFPHEYSIYLSSLCQTLSQALSPDFLGRHRKGTHRADETRKNHGRWTWRQLLHMAKRMRKATIRQKSPMASERAKPRIA